MDFLSSARTSSNVLSWKNEYLIRDNCVDNFPETKEEILLKLRECLNKYGIIECDVYKSLKTPNSKIKIIQENNGEEKNYKEEMNFSDLEKITVERLEENLNIITEYILAKKKTINYLRDGMNQNEILKEIKKIRSVREVEDLEDDVIIPFELNIFKGLNRKRIERRLKVLLMVVQKKIYYTTVSYIDDYNRYVIYFKFDELLRFNSDISKDKDCTWSDNYNFDVLKNSIEKMIYLIEEELNKVKKQEKISIKSSDTEGIMKELKEILKLNLPISINEAYEYESQSDNGFIQLSKEDNKIYLVENKNSYWDLYNLKDEGEVLELEKLKEHLHKIADLTIGNDKKVQDTLDWLNN